MSFSPNVSSRQGRKIDSVVLHSTAGTYMGSVSWLRNPQSGASAHYVISRMGEVTQLVAESMAAWHVRIDAGGEWNLRSIGIELVDDNIRDIGWYTDIQRIKLEELMVSLVMKYGIPLDSKHIVMHKEIQRGKSDPWGWEGKHRDALIAKIDSVINPSLPFIGELEMTDEQVLKIQGAINRIALVKRTGGNVLLYKSKDNPTIYYDEAMTKKYRGGWEDLLAEGYLNSDIIVK